jgi:hypothetical protein
VFVGKGYLYSSLQTWTLPPPPSTHTHTITHSILITAHLMYTGSNTSKVIIVVKIGLNNDCVTFSTLRTANVVPANTLTCRTHTYLGYFIGMRSMSECVVFFKCSWRNISHAGS